MTSIRTGGGLQADDARYRLLSEGNTPPSWVINEESGRFLLANDAAPDRAAMQRG